MTQKINTPHGHKYHGSPKDAIIERLRAELKAEQEKNRRLNLQLDQYLDSAIAQEFWRFNQNKEALEHLAVAGWKSSVNGAGGSIKCGSGNGDATAAAYLLTADRILRAMRAWSSKTASYMSAKERAIKGPAPVVKRVEVA